MSLIDILNKAFTGSVVAIAALSLGACASAPDAADEDAVAAYEEANDPIEPLNRYFFDVNMALDDIFLRPAAEIYHGALPDKVQDSVDNFLENLSQPIYFINNIAQGKVDRAGDNMGSFFTNTLLGIGGLFDIAQIDTPKEDFGQSLAIWGASEGPYLMVPVFGPYNTRHAVGDVTDYVIDPIRWTAKNNDWDGLPATRFILGGIDDRSRVLDTLDEIEKTSIDFYATIRSLYRQNRASLISDGEIDPSALPEMSFDFNDDDDLQEDEKISSLEVTPSGVTKLDIVFEEDDEADKKSVTTVH